jgi:hypothetical protein
MFGELIPHDEVLAAMKKEAADSHASKIDVLQREISELQMAQSAHLKVKAKKEEKHERMILDREPSPKMVQCSLDGCANEVNLLADMIECAICEWLHRKGGERGRYVYCSVEHAEIAASTTRRPDHQAKQTQWVSARIVKKRSFTPFSALKTASIITWYVLLVISHEPSDLF